VSFARTRKASGKTMRARCMAMPFEVGTHLCG
jgi:hypothetical protein